MNPEIKQKWVGALRSGEYQQGQRQLRRDDKFCCLGVLCDLHSKETGQKWVGEYYGDAHFILATWAELSSEVGVVIHNGEHKKLTQLNDNLNYSFEQIADLIEAQL